MLVPAQEGQDYKLTGQLPIIVSGRSDMASIIGGTRGLDRSLDRISSGIYENAVRLNLREHQRLARWAAVLQFREKLADLREGIKASQTYLRSVNAAGTCDFSVGWPRESVRA